jgi:hypothetical protein
LSSDTALQAEYDFTKACEAWAQSHDLDIFNDLLQPFQTQPLCNGGRYINDKGKEE